MKLYAKILVFLTVLLAAAFWANIHFSRLAVTEAMSGQIADAADSYAAAMAGDFRKAIASGSESVRIKALHEFSRKTGAVYCGLLSPDAGVLAHTNVVLAGTKMEDPLMLRGMRAGSIVFTRVMYGGEEILDAVIPLHKETASGEDLLLTGNSDDAPQGFIWTGLPLTPARKAERQIIYNLLILALAIAAAAALLSAGFARMLLRQVGALGEGIRKVRGGDFSVSVPVIARDELGEVAGSFNKLCRDLAATTVSMQYLDSVLESLPDPLLITDEEGYVLKANRAAKEFSGYDFLPPAGFNVKDILEQHADGATETFGLLSWTGHVNELDLWVKAKDGQRRPAMLSAAFIGTEGRRQVVTLLKDTARHKEAEARMAQYLKEVETVNSELDAFAHTVSHDLKEPLRGIEMFSGMLLSDHASRMDPQAADYLQRITKAAARMRRLIDDLLSYARVARVRNPYEECSTRKIAEEAVASLAPLLEQSKGEVKVSEALPDIFCDPVKIRQVFTNLIANSLKYNEKAAPRVEVKAEKFGEYYWKISVKDNGIGIPTQYYDDIFKMFKRLHGRQEYGGGTGAGLAIVKKIVEEHSGKIWLDSREGEGTVFFILIPADLRKKP